MIQDENPVLPKNVGEVLISRSTYGYCALRGAVVHQFVMCILFNTRFWDFAIVAFKKTYRPLNIYQKASGPYTPRHVPYMDATTI